MKLLSLTLPSFQENLALDEALLLEAEAGRGTEVLRLWEWPAPAVVLGAAGKLNEDVFTENCSDDAVPLGRRSSGGGTVVLGKGCLLYSLILRYERAEELSQIPSSYCYILAKIQKALSAHIAGIEPAGTSDLAVVGRKFSGNSQQRKRDHLLHHGSLLYDFDFRIIGRYLKMPVRQPEYRRGRDHEAFLMNLPMSQKLLKVQLTAIWEAEVEMNYWPETAVQRLVGEKYSQENWLHRR